MGDYNKHNKDFIGLKTTCCWVISDLPTSWKHYSMLFPPKTRSLSNQPLLSNAEIVVGGDGWICDAKCSMRTIKRKIRLSTPILCNMSPTCTGLVQNRGPSQHTPTNNQTHRSAKTAGCAKQRRRGTTLKTLLHYCLSNI